MSKDSNGRKTEFLGMPYGTAGNKLRKQLLFKYVKLVGDHVCWKCGYEIGSVDDLSIEHKEPWEGRSIDLFWDLDNIAFSHLKCNKPHRTNRQFLLGVEKKCSCCKQILPSEKFWKDNQKPSKLNAYCVECAKEKWKHRNAHVE